MSASNIVSHAERTWPLWDDESLREVLEFLVTEVLALSRTACDSDPNGAANPRSCPFSVAEKWEAPLMKRNSAGLTPCSLRRNPDGLTQGLQRRRRIYAGIAASHVILIASGG
jgi:hypothetical protein